MSRSDLPREFHRIIQEVEKTTSKELGARGIALLLWAGAATLTIRGSQKSIVGKMLEKVIARSALTVLGLSEQKGDFRLNLRADEEVQSEIDAEVPTNRGAIRIDIGLIGIGNTEAIANKIPRVGVNGVIVFDTLPPSSKVWQIARDERVKLIQMRESDPVNELGDHLRHLKVSVCQDAIPKAEIKKRIMKLPLELFSIEISSPSKAPPPKRSHRKRRPSSKKS